jgi:hypothetical protein
MQEHLQTSYQRERRERRAKKNKEGTRNEKTQRSQTHENVLGPVYVQSEFEPQIVGVSTQRLIGAQFCERKKEAREKRKQTI